MCCDAFVVPRHREAPTSGAYRRVGKEPNNILKVQQQDDVDEEKGDENVSSPMTENGLAQRWKQADGLEIRLDATLASSYVLARFLIYDIATGAKTTPGWELEDWIRIGSTLSSAIILCIYWTLSGLFVTQSFEYEDDENSNKTIIFTLVNAMVAAPLWLLSEKVLNYGPPGLLGPMDEVLVTGSLGLASVMVLAKQATKGWR